MNRGIIIFLLAFLFVSATHAQRWKLKRFEVIAGLGTANVFGDVGGASEVETWGGLKDYRLKDTRPSINLGARYRLTEEQSVKFNLTTGIGSGTDEGSINGLNPIEENRRTYKFTTILVEPSLQYEYYFLSEDRNLRSSAIYSRRGMVNSFSMLSLYGFAGVGGVLFAPSIEGETPVEPDKETLTNSAGFTAVIPVGVGVKYVLTSNMSLNLEAGRRFTFTDNLDGLTTVYSKSNDVYYFGTLSVVYKLTTTRRGIPIIFEGGSRVRKSGKKPTGGSKPIGM
jgi:opacity protein-like surface antigen